MSKTTVTKRDYDPSDFKTNIDPVSITEPNPNSMTIGELFRNYAGGTQGLELPHVYLDPNSFDQDLPDLEKMTRREIKQFQLSLNQKLHATAKAEYKKQQDKVKDRTEDQIQQIEKEEKHQPE